MEEAIEPSRTACPPGPSAPGRADAGCSEVFFQHPARKCCEQVNSRKKDPIADYMKYEIPPLSAARFGEVGHPKPPLPFAPAMQDNMASILPQFAEALLTELRDAIAKEISSYQEGTHPLSQQQQGKGSARWEERNGRWVRVAALSNVVEVSDAPVWRKGGAAPGEILSSSPRPESDFVAKSFEEVGEKGGSLEQRPSKMVVEEN